MYSLEFGIFQPSFFLLVYVKDETQLNLTLRFVDTFAMCDEQT